MNNGVKHWEDRGKVYEDGCPYCGSRDFIEGPCGAENINIKCDGCGAEFNDKYRFGIDLIKGPDETPQNPGKAESALDVQVGGSHYKGFVIQPVEFSTRNNLGFLQGSVVKRIARYNQPGGKGLEDLEKIKHEVDLLIEIEGWKG